MTKILGLGVLVIGAVLLFYGVNERDSVTSQVKEVLTGAPTEHSVLLMACGGGLAVVGVGLVLFGKRST